LLFLPQARVRFVACQLLVSPQSQLFSTFTAGSGLNGARFGSIRVVAVVLEKQPCEVHVCTSPRGGKGQQPINVAHRAPMRRVLIKSFSRGQNPFPRWLEGDNDENK
jgi:hypothetical protein